VGTFLSRFRAREADNLSIKRIERFSLLEPLLKGPGHVAWMVIVPFVSQLISDGPVMVPVIVHPRALVSKLG
jgi:hypothetical protein